MRKVFQSRLFSRVIMRSMNCTICGKPHSKEQPLTVAHNNEFLCPGCLKELDQYGNNCHVGESGIVFPEATYGKSPITVAEAFLKVGDIKIRIEKLELK